MAGLDMAYGPHVEGSSLKISAEVTAFSDRLGHRFANPALLLQALTHPSMGSPSREHNQRLEFLGDRVLGLSISEALFRNDKGAAEGTLAPRFNALVRKETCAEVAREIDLGAVLRLGRSEMKSGGRRKEALLADAMEAVLAAIYLDAGFEAARAVILQLWSARLESVDADARDPKTTLQEWAQARGMSPPAYVETGREGPDHAPVFTVEVRLADGKTANAVATSKRTAEQLAAKALLDLIGA